MSIKAIVFDKDGTLMKFEDFWIPVAEHAVELISAELSIGRDKSQLLLDAINTYGSKSGILCYGTYKDMSDAFAKILKDIGVYFDSDKLYRLTVNSFHQSMRFGEIKAICGDLPDVLCGLKKSGYILSLATADDIYGAEQFLNKLKIADYFDEVFTFDGIHPAKPNPYYVKTICRKYNLAPSEIIMVGDTLIDMDFAKNSNVTAVGVAEKDNDKKYLKQYTKYVLGNVSEIADFLKNGVIINDISC